MKNAAIGKTSPGRPKGRESARERILAAAYDLFRHHGTRNVGVDEIVQRSGVAKMSLYRHFGSKQELVAAFLQRREELWTYDWLRSEACRRSGDPGDRLLAIFDIFGEWFRSRDFDGCSFINVLLEYPSDDAARRSAGAHLANIRAFLEGLAAEAGISDTKTFADTWHIMMKGAIVAACEGNHDAAREIKVAARLFLEASLPPDDNP